MLISDSYFSTLEGSPIAVKRKKGTSIEAKNYDFKHESFHIYRLHMSIESFNKPYISVTFLYYKWERIKGPK